jgi:hypothetical protein
MEGKGGMSEYDNSVQPAIEDQTIPTSQISPANKIAGSFGEQTPEKQRLWS